MTHENKRRDRPMPVDWSTGVGVLVVLGLICLLALTAAGGWPWVANFLSSAAPAWVQAVGSVAAIIATLLVVQRQHEMEVWRRSVAEREESLRRVRALKAIFFSAAQACERVGRQLNADGGAWLLEAATIRAARDRLVSIDPLQVPDAALLMIIETAASGLFLSAELVSELNTPRPDPIREVIGKAVMKSARECWLGLYETTAVEAKLAKGGDIDLDRSFITDFEQSRAHLDKIRCEFEREAAEERASNR